MNAGIFRKRDFQILGVAVFLFACLKIFTVYFEPDEPDEILYLSSIWISFSILLIFVFIFLLNRIFDYFMNWKAYPVSRFLSQMLLGTLVSLLAINLSYNIIKDQFTSAPPDANQMLLLNIYGFALILPIFSLYFGFKFLKAWRKSEIETEQLQKENARSQMMTLRNHLDPHFLFNNLNILSSLMDKDISLSKDYLDKFAEVYRIILRTDYSDLITVSEEMKLVDSYLYLLKIRFDESVLFDIRIDQKHLDMAVPPLSLQMLIENAIKHNRTSSDNPVRLKIYSSDNNEIVVENNKVIKKYGEKGRSGTGLDNIRKRYAFFSEKNIDVSDGKYNYKVTLPLLEIEYV
ncbi:MAG: histidine kinase [Saprospiraceae bacterium]|nr:histidine kinase [Saprospiraceae bacterium]